LLIVGGADYGVIELNESARDRLACLKQMVLVSGATHLFEEPGAMHAVLERAIIWFSRYLNAASRSRVYEPFADRTEAGRKLASELMHLKSGNPVVLALPRGGVPVAFEVARALRAPLEIVLARKIGAPDQPELGLGAVVDGVHPQVVLNQELVELVQPGETYLRDEEQRQLREIERRRALYGLAGRAVEFANRTVVVVDDGIATGGTVRAVLQAIRNQPHGRVVLAVPVAPADTIRELAPLTDEIVCLMSPEPYLAVGVHYRDFTQTTDEEVIDLLRRARIQSPL